MVGMWRRRTWIPTGIFSAQTRLRSLTAAIKNEYQAKPMNGATLEATVARYNSFVDAGEDKDFGKPKPKYQDSDAAVLRCLGDAAGSRHSHRFTHQCEMPGDRPERSRSFPGLYCAGESAGGFNQHGMGRCATQGFIAGRSAAVEKA